MPRRRDAALFAASFAPAFTLAAFVGWLARSSGHFAWEPAAVSGTGMATASLAFFTARLAASTSEDVSATIRLAGIEAARFAREDEPLVVAGPERIDFSPGGSSMIGGWSVHVDLVNVGRGPARDIRWEAYNATVGGGETARGGDEIDRGNAGALVGGAGTNARFSPWTDANAGRYGVRGTYSDRDRTDFRVFGDQPPNGWPAWLDARFGDEWWGLEGRSPESF